MKGLAVKLTNGNTTLYTNTDHVFIGGTNHLCLRTGNATTDVVSYPLTTNTSASQYSPIRVKINGSNCYLASLGHTQDVKYTLPLATILNFSTDNLLLNTYSEYYFVSNRPTRVLETNSVRRGDLYGQEEVEWPGKYSYVPAQGPSGYDLFLTETKYKSFELPANDNDVFIGYDTVSTTSVLIPSNPWYGEDWEVYYDTIPDSPNLAPAFYAGGGEVQETYFTLNEFTKSNYSLTDPAIYTNLISGKTTVTTTSQYFSSFSTNSLAYDVLFSYFENSNFLTYRYDQSPDLIKPAVGFYEPQSTHCVVRWELYYHGHYDHYITTDRNDIGDRVLTLSATYGNHGYVIPVYSPEQANNLNYAGSFYSNNARNVTDLCVRMTTTGTGVYTYLRPELQGHQYNDTRTISESLAFSTNIGYYLKPYSNYFTAYTDIVNGNKRTLAPGQRQGRKYEKIPRASRSISVDKNQLSVSTYHGQIRFGQDVPYYEHKELVIWELAFEGDIPDEYLYEGGKQYYWTYRVPIEGGGGGGYYVPQTYTRYSLYVTTYTPIYQLSYHYNYSTTTKYSLSVPGMATYTSSLPYNMLGVTYESSKEVLYNLEYVLVITKTENAYNYGYSTNVLVPYFSTVYNLNIILGNYIDIKTTKEYTDEYTNAALCPSGKTFVGSHTEPENKVVQLLHLIAAATAPNGTLVGPYYKTSREYYANSVYDTGPTKLEGAEPSAITNLNEYTKATRLGDYYAGSVSSYKSTYGYKVINGINVNTGYVMTATKNKYYGYDLLDTVVYDLDTYFSTAIKLATDTNLGYYDQVVDPIKTVVYWNGYGNPKASDTVNWESSKTSKDPVWEKVGNDTVTNGRYSSKSSATDTAFYGTKSASNSYADMAKKFFGATWSLLNKKNFAYNTSTWTEYRTTTNDSSTAYKNSVWPGQTFTSYSTSRTTSFAGYVFYKYVKANSYTGKARRSSTQSTQTYSVKRISSQRIYISGRKTRYINRSSFRSGARKNAYNYTTSSIYDLSSKSFTDAYQYYENINTVITHTIVTLEELSLIRSSETRYTLQSSYVSEKKAGSYLSTYTTAHTYNIDILSNNVNV